MEQDHSATLESDFELKLPHRGFRRSIGEFGSVNVTPDGQIVSGSRMAAPPRNGCRSHADRDFVASLMKPVTAPGRFASWIAPPVRGINHQALDFEYVTAIPAN